MFLRRVLKINKNMSHTDRKMTEGIQYPLLFFLTSTDSIKGTKAIHYNTVIVEPMRFKSVRQNPTVMHKALLKNMG